MLLVGGDQIRERSSQLGIYKPVGPEGMHPQALRELADGSDRSLPIISERLWGLGEVSEGWWKVNVAFRKGQTEHGGNRGRTDSPQFLGSISQHMMGK